MLLQTHAAPGIHRIGLGDSYNNWYLIEDDDRLTVVDAGLPCSWDSLHAALARLGRSPVDIAAVVLTHGHFDHMGFAERARAELGVPVYVHENDVPLTSHPWRYDHERARAPYFTTQTRAFPIFATYLRHRAFWPSPLAEVVRFSDAETLDIAGSPRVVPTPGHTLGHCALHFPDRDAVIAGDAIVTLDPYTGQTGPRLVARAATVDSERNLRSLDALARTEASTVLVGHGEPWTGGIEAAVAQARVAGAA